MDAANTETQTRDAGNGQYVHADDVMCKCGHTVGAHSAASHKGRRDCFADGCDCMKVRKVRIKK